MRLPESKIKQAILHPTEEVRLAAVSYFADSHNTDASIMPLVIQAVEKYGRDVSFRILRDAEHLVQTSATLDWTLHELRRDFDTDDIEDDNLRLALALVVLSAPIDLLRQRKPDIDGLHNFPAELRGSIDERLQMADWTWEQGWEALEELGRKTLKRGEFTPNENRHSGRIIESLAQYADVRGEFVLDLLHKNQQAKASRLLFWLESEIVRLAGEMRLQAAIPILIEHLHSEDASIADESTTALMRIGTDAVVTAIAVDWPNSGDDFRGYATDVLEKDHSDLSVETCLAFLDAEEDLDTALALGYALMSHFPFEGIDPVRELILVEEDEMSPDHFDLLYRLVVAATIMEADFPEYDVWLQDAVENNWGWGDYKRARLADAFRSDPIGPKTSGNGRR